jgi:hypothetical protein
VKRLVLLIVLFVAAQSLVPTAQCAFDMTSMAEELTVMETVANATASKTAKAADANVASEAKVKDSSRSIENVRDIDVTEADANAAVEPNEEDPNAKMLKDIEVVFEDLKRGSQKEDRGWIQLKAEKKTQLAKAVQDQVLDELNALRKIAVEEDAVKTTAAIDMLIADRQERFKETLKRMDAEEEKMRRRESRESRNRRSHERDRDRERRQRRTD